MKFDNFVKYAGTNGIIFEAENGDKWLFYNGTGMKVPDGIKVCGKIDVMPDFIEELINCDDYEPCELTAAFLPAPDSKPSELMRKFKCPLYDDLEIDIPNKIFGFIEKSNETFVSTFDIDDETQYTALLVTDDYGDDKEFKMIYIVKE